MTMKIAYVIPYADSQRGGAEAWLMGLSAFMIEAGHEVTLLCRAAGKVPKGVRVKEFPVKGSAAQKIKSFWDQLDIYLKKHDYHIVHSLDLCPHMNVHNPHGGAEGVWLKQYLSSKKGLDQWFSTLKRQWGARQKLVFELEAKQLNDPALKKIVAISPFVKRSLQEAHQLPESLFSVIPNGTDVTRFFPMPEEEVQSLKEKEGLKGKKMLLFVAHNFSLKGLSNYIEIIARLHKAHPEHDVQGWVVGAGRAEPYQKLARQLGVSERVHFKGRVESVTAAYNMAHVMVAPTYYDACSLSTLESLLCGTPVVTTACNGASLYIEEGKTGFVVKEPTDIAALTNACHQLMNLERDDVYKHSVKEGVQHYTREANSLAYLEVYREVLSQKV